MLRNKVILHGLDQNKYEHPFDNKALDRLEAIPFLTKATKWITENTIEKIYTVQFTGSHLKVTRDNYPKIYEYLEYACEILDIGNVPSLYIQWGYEINACTIGAENPIIVLNSGLFDLCNEDEILFVIGHELGHIKSNHMLYHMMAECIDYVIEAIPGGKLIAGGIEYAIYYWSRMSEFTADRAGFLCCQNIDAAVSSFIKMSGLPKEEYKNIHMDTFIQQANDFEMLDYDGMSRFVKFISIANDRHPWTVMRASELLKWKPESIIEKI